MAPKGTSPASGKSPSRSASRSAAIEALSQIRQTLAKSDQVQERAIPALKRAGYIK